MNDQIKTQSEKQGSHIDRLDCLSEAIAKAQAMIFMTFGESGGSFRRMSRETQDNFLWALCDHIESAGQHLAKLQDELTKQ